MKTDSDYKSHGSIRSRLTGAVMIPSIALLVMWVLASSYLVFDGYYVREVALGVRNASLPAVSALASAQKERQLSMAYLGRKALGTAELRAQQQTTDDAVRVMRTEMTPLIKNAPPDVADGANQLLSVIDQLPGIRSRIEGGDATKENVYSIYNNLLDAGYRLFNVQARIVPDPYAVQGAMDALSFVRASDYMSRAGSLVTGAFALSAFSAEDHLQFTSLVGAYHSELDKSIPNARKEVQEIYPRLTNSDAWKKLVSAESALITNGPWVRSSGTNGRGAQSAIPITETEWLQVTTRVADELANLLIKQADVVSATALQAGTTKLITVAIGAIIALALSIASIVIASRVSRKLVDKALVVRLASLRNEALELAHRKLPNLVNRLRKGDAVKVSTEVPELDYGKDEIGQVASAFNAAQLTAVAAAVKEAQAREGINNVFLGIAHRNQGLVHRQLKILDRMERHEEDPEQLEGLFQLDHLATRARRNAENLIILGGEQPGRRWRNPIRLVDVLRAAISETEHYVRVRLQRVPEAAIVGSAVADTIHLVAELVDNATSFSPPRSQVQVHGSLAAKGVVVEVEDHGLGMSEEDQAAANAMLSDPPEFDAMALKGDSRLGLFVVARLASRLGVKVELRTSPYGGTRAIILIPNEVLASKASSEDMSPGTNPGLSRHQHTPPNGTPFPPQSRTEQTGVDQVTAHRQRHSAAPVDTGARLGADLESFWSEPLGDEDSDGGRPLNLLGGLSFEAVREVPGPDLDPIVDEPRSGHPVETPRYSHTGPIPVYTGNSQTEPPVPEAPRAGMGDNVRPRPALPQRKPQQSLAPQLRAEPAPVPQIAEDLAEHQRSAEEIRNTMSAFQRGTREGRNADSPFES
ncbi:nitrate- and nitrite sensing domain-containing protein [Allokutzneria sp. A3M-2-11 16]|uniref:nitrate- and nitrite sensing domain-containing protein n=1 Tax=Allokutzneria sp. A3M-2-11 16 TaxID=2962043 RepID=UPI0020B7C802|nr:nitrate- and nitrite sensing domain-containing protein [Allokutzneria sp. A3M-2-11 16]MCP3802518.1 nitrate- and nitrite sensing domain-containing protein [Allokutzneria sp. A3M-2-11 16]